MNRDFARYWPLDEDVTFITHGTYGATPWPVLHAQSEWRARMERQPVRFLNDELEMHVDHARARLAEFVRADPVDLAFVPNATTGVNTVLRALEPTLAAGDEILTTDHDYNACINAIQDVAARTGARAVMAHVPIPVASADDFAEAVLERAGPRTRLAVLSHVTSPTALVVPIQRLVGELAARGVDTLVDGAHAPGMVPLDLAQLGAAYYTGNGHKWLCAPKGSGFLHVRRDRQAGIRPLIVSHGTNSPRGDRTRFRLEFDWTGTGDPTPYLAITAALDFVASLVPGGWPEVMDRNQQLALAARAYLVESVGRSLVGPPEMVGSMVAIEIGSDLPPSPVDPAPGSSSEATWPIDPLRFSLLTEDRIEVPVYPWPHTPGGAARRRLLRISAQLYNELADYERLAAALSRRATTPDRTVG